MALSNKKSRPITVDGCIYRWQFFENSGWNDVTIQRAEGSGQKLIVQLPWDHTGTPHISLLPPVTPSHVKEMIQRAGALGWSPATPEKPLRLQWRDGDLKLVSQC